MDRFTLKGENKTYLLYRFMFEPVKSNMFVIINNQEALVFDPCENDELIDLLKENKVKNVSILLTHEHYDHTSGVKWLLTYYDAKVYCHVDCARVISVKRKNNPALVALVWADMDRKDNGNRYHTFKQHFQPYTILADITFEDFAEWRVSGIKIKSVSTPGHSPGSCFYWIDNNIVFTGDTLLQDAPIILKFPESDNSTYKTKTLPYLKSLDKETILIPGHGDPFVLKRAKYLK